MVLLFSALGLLAVIVVYDLLQRQHAILRNFPIIGHFRYCSRPSARSSVNIS